MGRRDELQDLATALKAPKGVRKLDLSRQKLDSLPKTIGTLNDLVELSLGHNELPAVPDSIGELTALERLVLAGNPIEALPAAMGTLAKVTELDVRGTRLAGLPAEIGGTKALVRLLASATPLESLPPQLGELQSLEHIELGQTKLVTLPDELGKLEKLQFLDLRGAPLESLPDSIGDCTSLRWLRLANTSLTSLPDTLAHCTNLEMLDLEGTTFSAEGGERLAALVATLKKGAKLEIVRWPTMPRIARSAPADELGANVLRAIRSLGGVLRKEPPEDAPTIVKAMGRDHALPAAYRRFMFGVEWPAEARFSAELPDGIDAWDLRFDVWGELEDYACSRTRPYVSIGDWDGGNYFVVLALDDFMPDDPAVYRLDHDDFDRAAPSPIGLQLSEFLACLEDGDDEEEDEDE